MQRRAKPLLGFRQSQATKRHTAALRPGCRSIPAVKFRQPTELNGATKAPFPFYVALRTSMSL